MYSREYEGRELHFEASGGLMNSSLVMQDRETDSFWSIMTGTSVGGSLEGTDLVELPYGEKVRWDQWKSRHPDTLVLSVNGRQFARDGYEGYWADPTGFRGQVATDERLETKAPIYAFEMDGIKYAVPHRAFEGGATFELAGGRTLFLHRQDDDELFASSSAFLSRDGAFARDDDGWISPDGARFDPDSSSFPAAARVERVIGFDTFWYNWSLNNPQTELLQ